LNTSTWRAPASCGARSEARASSRCVAETGAAACWAVCGAGAAPDSGTRPRNCSPSAENCCMKAAGIRGVPAAAVPGTLLAPVTARSKGGELRSGAGCTNLKAEPAGRGGRRWLLPGRVRGHASLATRRRPARHHVCAQPPKPTWAVAAVLHGGTIALCYAGILEATARGGAHRLQRQRAATTARRRGSHCRSCSHGRHTAVSMHVQLSKQCGRGWGGRGAGPGWRAVGAMGKSRCMQTRGRARAAGAPCSTRISQTAAMPRAIIDNDCVMFDRLPLCLEAPSHPAGVRLRSSWAHRPPGEHPQPHTT